MVHFLFDGNDVEYIDDERHQYDHNQNVDKTADIRGVASFGQQEPFEFFSQYVTSRIIKGAGIKPGWGFLPASEVWRKPHTGYGGFRLRMNFHDTHSNIWDLPCKSQSCASFGKFCANVVPDMKRNIIIVFFMTVCIKVAL